MHQIRQRTQTNTRPDFTCGGLSSEEMTAKEWVQIMAPQSEITITRMLCNPNIYLYEVIFGGTTIGHSYMSEECAWKDALHHFKQLRSTIK